MVLRNEIGEFVAGDVKPCTKLTLPFHLELPTLVDGMKLVKTLNYSCESCPCQSCLHNSCHCQSLFTQFMSLPIML